MSNANDKLVQAVNEFKKSLNGQTISIHGKSYATVSLRVAVARRVLGSSLDIVTKIVHIDKESVVTQTDIFIDDKTKVSIDDLMDSNNNWLKSFMES